MSDCTKCPKCGAPHKHSDPDGYHEYKCGSFHWRDCFNEESRCAIRQQAQEELRAQLEAVTKERDEAWVKYNLAESELWLGELRERIAKLTDQRDRAMQCVTDAFWSDEIPTEFRELEEEIAKEKEVKG